MPQVAMTVPHVLGREEALRRLKLKAQELHQIYDAQIGGLQEQWVDSRVEFSFTTIGMRFQCQVQIEEQAIQLQAEVPMLALAFRPMIERKVQEELGHLLA